MNIEALKNASRDTHQWWAVADDAVIQLTCYSCAPANPRMWWCPKVGMSMSEGHHLFKTEMEAITRLEVELTERIDAAHDKLEGLLLRRRNLTR